MRKALIKLLLSLLFFAFAANGNSQPIYLIKNISTGVYKNSVVGVIPYGNNDDGWQVRPPREATAFPVFSPAKVCNNLNGSWQVNSCGRWITDLIVPNNNQPSDLGYINNYTFSLKFHYANFSVFNDVFLKIDCMGVDDQLRKFYVNGCEINLPASFYVSNLYNPINCNSVIIPLRPVCLIDGENEIIIVTQNTNGAYKGLFLCAGIYTYART